VPVQDLGTLESILSRVLPESKVAYVLGGLEGLIASIVVRTLPKVKAFNSNGVWKMCRYSHPTLARKSCIGGIVSCVSAESSFLFMNRNVFALEQSLSQLGYAGDGVAFEAARRYYRLLTLPPDELVAYLLRPASASPTSSGPLASASLSRDGAGQEGRGYYTVEEYKALLAHLDKSPAHRHLNFDALLKALASAAAAVSPAK
jgi:hypothetical protein